jgi:hypothetical protein
MKRVLTLAALLVLLAAPAAQAAALPFGPGEKLSYKLYWTFILAGTATLETLDPARWRGGPRCTSAPGQKHALHRHLLQGARLHRVLGGPGGDPRHPLPQGPERGHYVRHYLVRFDANGNVAYRYSKGRAQERGHHPAGHLRSAVHVVPVPHQPLAVGYSSPPRSPMATRASPARPRCAARTREDPGGRVRHLLVEPDVRDIGGVFRKSPDATLQVWITDDARRIPVRVKSKVAVGHFSMELTGYEPRNDAGRIFAPTPNSRSSMKARQAGAAARARLGPTFAKGVQRRPARRPAPSARRIRWRARSLNCASTAWPLAARAWPACPRAWRALNRARAWPCS